MSLYRTYRPQDFTTLVGQDFIKESLQNALRQEGKLVGAYLFHGSRGTGKTSVARILAKAMNCLHLLPDGNPCRQCEHCVDFERDAYLDVVEIDAASNTGVENVRELIERSRFAPSRGKYKVYIIDEVHMLSKGAFNALLKTLEEPPEHVRFILATTEIHKIPDTIISRVQRYDFRQISEENIHARLRYIADTEHIDAEDDALALLARIARGGMRDAITLLEQYSVTGTLRLAVLEEHLGFVSDTTIALIVDALVRDDRTQALTLIDSYRGRSVDVRRFVEQILITLRDRIADALDTPAFARYIRMFDVFADVYDRLRSTPDPFILMEVGILRLIHHAPTETIIPQLVSPPPPPPRKNPPPKAVTTTQKVTEAPTTRQTFEEVSSLPSPAITPSAYQDTSVFDMGTLIERITLKKSFVGMSLRACRHRIMDDILILIPSSDFHAGKLNPTEVRSLIIDEIKSIYGLDLSLRIEKGGSTAVASPTKTSLADEAMDIF